MQARFYLPQYHRFSSPDPARDQHFEDTQSWNIYSYCQNSPVMRTDPTGMFNFLNTYARQTLQCNQVYQHSPMLPDAPPPVRGDIPAKSGSSTTNPAQAQTGLKADGNLDPEGKQAKADAIKAGAVSGDKVDKLPVYAYGGTTEQRTAELAAFKKVLTESDQGKSMLDALESRKTWFGFGSVKPFDLISMDSGGSHTFLGSQSIMLDQHDVGASYRSRFGGGTFSLERIFGHELGHAAMGVMDNGPGRMNNVTTNENTVMRQLGDFNDRIAY